MIQNLCQVDVHQLQAGRSPSLLPFDSLLMSYPVTSSWRRQVAEAHSRRYAQASTVLGGSGELFIDVNRTTEPTPLGQQDFHVQAPEGMRVGGVYSNAEEPTGTMSGSNGGRVSLDIGFIGHDFDEHPTAHMIEGVFVWQKRLAGIKHEIMGVSEALETGGKGSSGEWPATYRTTPTAAVECCR